MRTILSMVSQEFLMVVLFAGVVALPAAWYLMSNWLSDFAYRVRLRIDMCALAAFIALLIAFATISFRTIRATTANPVDALRSV